MKKLWLLIKIYLLKFSGFNKLKYSHDPKARKKQKLRAFGGVVIVLLSLFSICVSYYGNYYVFSGMGRPELILTLGAAGACMFMLILTLLRAGQALFGFKDFDLVMALPVKGSTVVMSRIGVLYLQNVAFMFLLMLPAAGIYAVFERPGAIFYPLMLLGALLLPLIPLLIGSALGTVITLVAARFKRKNLLTSFLTILLALGIMLLSMSISSEEQMTQMVLGTIDALGRIYPPAFWYMNGCLGDLPAFLLYTGVSVALFGLFSVLVGRYFGRLNTAFTARIKIKNAKKQSKKTNSKSCALYRKELTRYFASPIYVTNTAFGGVLLLAAAAAFLCVGSETVLGALQLPAGEELIRKILPFALGLFCVMSATTPVSISIEGNRFWQIRVLPVTAKELLSAKLALSLTIILPPLAISATLFAIALKADLLSAFLLFVVPLGYSLLAGVLGLWLNLAFPKFDWESETEIVKQGMPTMLNVFGGMFVTIGPAVLFAACGLPLWAELATGIFLIGLAFLIWRGLLRRADEKLLIL